MDTWEELQFEQVRESDFEEREWQRRVIGVNVRGEVGGGASSVPWQRPAISTRRGSHVHRRSGQAGLFVGEPLDIPAAAAAYRAPTPPMPGSGIQQERRMRVGGATAANRSLTTSMHGGDRARETSQEPNGFDTMQGGELLRGHGLGGQALRSQGLRLQTGSSQHGRSGCHEPQTDSSEPALRASAAGVIDPGRGQRRRMEEGALPGVALGSDLTPPTGSAFAEFRAQVDQEQCTTST